MGYELIRERQVCLCLLTITDSWLDLKSLGPHLPAPQGPERSQTQSTPFHQVPPLNWFSNKNKIVLNQMEPETLSPRRPVQIICCRQIEIKNKKDGYKQSTGACFVPYGSCLSHQDILESAGVAMMTAWWRQMQRKAKFASIFMICLGAVLLQHTNWHPNNVLPSFQLWLYCREQKGILNVLCLVCTFKWT